jgi:glycosyltransferase involved in cell wall biosynthesis
LIDPRTNSARLLFVVSEDWYFISHRLPMARAARDAGFEIHVATRVGNAGAAIEAEGFILHPIPFARGRLSPLASLATIRALRGIYARVQPAVVHHVALQTSVLGLVASFDRPVPTVCALTGLGYLFTSSSVRARFAKVAARPALRLLLNRRGVTSLVQNGDDYAALTALGVNPSHIALIRGSGVDVNRLVPLPEPPDAVTIAFVGRLLEDKGIRTLVAAHRLLRANGSDLQLLIAGTTDPANPASVPEKEVAAWSKEPGIILLGHVDDISGLWQRAHLAVLPSRREGLPLSLLEAAACQRGMIASDVPGCREIVIHEKTGLLFPVDDAPALAKAIAKLAAAPDLRRRYAAAARTLAVENFSADVIGRNMLDLYRKMLSDCVDLP